jgi:Mrp family chromosome partitioning ATPase
VSIRSQEQVALLTDYDVGSAYSAAYRTLYANVRFNWQEEEATEEARRTEGATQQHTLLLATPNAYTGQATVAANVAIAAAQSGTPTILVDADLRTPGLVQRFGLASAAGLGDLLAADADTLTPQIMGQHLSSTFIPGLRLLGAGTASSEAVPTLAAKFEEVFQALCLFLKETEKKPSLVIFHSTPVLTGPEASLIAAHAEQTLLTIAKGKTTRKQAKQAQEQLERVHAHLTGVVMLNV